MSLFFISVDNKFISVNNMLDRRPISPCCITKMPVKKLWSG